ncbi:winged helix DNA-binding domain-containing protein [Streptomyces polyrhachis]|uniref:Winged helix DNA-binding domain-containing protein n=1 Tax=Streptomyces polyrhachis TaxID=1282885 RepID=A0ABW2GDE5_9ACTN
MKLSARELNRATLARQLLLEREHMPVEEAVRRVVALQAQQPASPYLALWNRLAAFEPAELDAAFAGRRVVKATLMRITLHAVHADDYPVLRAAMQPVLHASRLGSRFAASGLTPAEGHQLALRIADFATEARTTAELRGWLGEQLGPKRADAAWWGMSGYAPLHRAPAEAAPWSFGARSLFRAAALDPVPVGREVDEPALRTLLLRYLAGFGPASVADMAQFTLLPKTPIRAALRALAGELAELQGPDNAAYFDLPDAPRPPADTPAPPRLMAMWDSTLLAYADRPQAHRAGAAPGRLIPPDYRRVVIRANGDVLPTLLVDGHVAGVWRPLPTGIEATAFHPLPPATWQALTQEAQSLAPLLAARDRTPYSRFDHWWPKLPKLPEGETRMLFDGR